MKFPFGQNVCEILFFKNIYIFVCFWLCWVFVGARGLFLVVASGSYSSLWCAGFSLQWLLLLRSTGSRHVDSVVVAHGLQSTGSVVVGHGVSCSAACGIFLDQDRTCVPCTGRRILNHCATREVPVCEILYCRIHLMITSSSVLMQYFKINQVLSTLKSIKLCFQHNFRIIKEVLHPRSVVT